MDNVIKQDSPNSISTTENDFLFKSWLNQLPVGSFLTDKSGMLIYSNKPFLNLLGAPKTDTLITDILFNAIHPQDLISAKETWQILMNQHLPIRLEFRKASNTASYKWLRLEANVFKNANDEHSGFSGTLVDISDRKQTEIELQLSENRLRSIIEAEPECVKVVDAEGKLLEMNSAGLAMLEVDSLEEAKSMSLFDFILPEYRLAFQSLHKRVMSGENGILEFEVLGKKGTQLWLETHATPLRNEMAEIDKLLGITRNITERKQAEVKMHDALALAQKTAQTRSHFLDVASHELRTPITGLSLLLQMTKKNLALGKPVEEGTLMRLRTQVDHISNLVTDLLDVSRLERGNVILRTEELELSKLIETCLEEFRLLQPERIISFSASESSTLIKADPLRIYQVLSNLLNNAIRYTPINTSIEIRVDSFSQTVRVSVRDHGSGIALNQVAELFEPFKRGSNEFVSNSPGLGLGLFISREILSLHGGKIELINNLGGGCTFYFELPKLN